MAVLELTRERVHALADEGEMLIIIAGNVYDVKAWSHKHPGGILALKHVCGRDATAVFRGMHSESTERVFLPSMLYGKLIDDNPSQLAADFEDLRADLTARGLFKANLTYTYTKLFQYLFGLLGPVWLLVLYSESFAAHCLAGALMGLFFQQMAFLGHDAGHNAVSHSLAYDRKFGLLVGNFLTGLSVAWWKRNHNTHHIVTNSVEHDPDIQHLPVLAISASFFKTPVWSTFYKRFLDRTKLAVMMLQYQHWLYYVIMSVARINLYAQGLMLMFSVGPYAPSKSLGEPVWRRDLELYCVIGHIFWHGLLLSYLPDFSTRACFFMIANAVAGILHVQITLSHFSMPCFTESQDTLVRDDEEFIRKQLAGSLDIDCHPAMDWFHGGLQFQALHHLFPRIPRCHLRAALPIVKEFCRKHDLTYHSVGFIEANLMTIRTLRNTADHAEELSPLIWEGLSAIG